MIVPLAALALAAYIALRIFRAYASLKRHIAEAERSNIPYVVAPGYFLNRFWLITAPLFMPLIRRLPTAWTKEWIEVARPMWLWRSLRKPFDQIGGDTFLVVSPGRTQLYTCDAEVITQITTRRTDFPKPLEMYGALDIYGPNLVSSEGIQWRHHRRITAPPFNDRNNRLVWTDTLHQTEQLIYHWKTIGHDENGTIQTLVDDCMKLALHVISRAGFGIPLLWPNEEKAARERGEEGLSSSAVPEGHEMSFRDALATLLQNLIPIILLPKWFLAIAPFKRLRLAYKSYYEWGRYMNKMITDKKAEMSAGKPVEGFDILGTFIRSAGTSSEFSDLPAAEKAQLEQRMISNEELLGNMFVMLLAGHETTANTIHYSILFLAIERASQQRFQRELDDIFGDRPPSQWSYDDDAPKLFGGMAGAIMQEQLRMIPPVVGIPKSTPKDSPQPININGRRCLVPENTAITLDSVATHRNAKHWPCATPQIDPLSNDYDLNKFRPERWLLDPDRKTVDSTDGGPAFASDADTSSSHIRPQKGSFIPFSDGPRSCIGRRFAQVEALVVLSVLFREYSIELAVDDWASDEKIARMSREERQAVYQKAIDRVNYYWKEKTIVGITLQFRGVHVPVRMVRRGEERFF